MHIVEEANTTTEEVENYVEYKNCMLQDVPGWCPESPWLDYSPANNCILKVIHI
jgi:hypothetical protein